MEVRGRNFEDINDALLFSNENSKINKYKALEKIKIGEVVIIEGTGFCYKADCHNEFTGIALENGDKDSFIKVLLDTKNIIEKIHKRFGQLEQLGLEVKEKIND